MSLFKFKLLILLTVNIALQMTESYQVQRIHWNKSRATLNLVLNYQKRLDFQSTSRFDYLLKCMVGDSIVHNNSSATLLPTAATTNLLLFSKVLNSATNLFPIWVLLFSLGGNKKPHLFTWFTPYITAALSLTMLSMGMTLTMADFYRVLQSPQFILVGFFAQYFIMPFSAYFIAKLFQLGPELSSGLILVGCAPGGTASNLVALIAHADVPLSVLMTLASTIAAVFMTPFLASTLAKSYVKIKASDLVFSTLNVVLIPVLVGLLMNTLYPKTLAKVSPYTSLPCILLVSMICGTVAASNAGISLGMSSAKLLLAIILLHISGFLWGYVFAKYLKSGEQRARTISIETGMQNSALAVVLAQHFPSPHMVALPGSISATCHSVIGSILATIWRNRKSIN